MLKLALSLPFKSSGNLVVAPKDDLVSSTLN